MAVSPAPFHCPDCHADVTQAVWEKGNAEQTVVYRLVGQVSRRLRRRRERPQTFTVKVTCPNQHTHRYRGQYPEGDD